MATYTNQYNEVLTRKPELLATLQTIDGIKFKESPDAVLVDLAKSTHHGALSIASDYLETSAKSAQWRTIRTWLGAGSKVIYFYGETLDLLLVDHGHGNGFQAYKGYSILG